MPASETNPVDPRYPVAASGHLYSYPLQEEDGSTVYYLTVKARTAYSILLSAAELRDFAVACIGMVAKEEARV